MICARTVARRFLSVCGIAVLVTCVGCGGSEQPAPPDQAGGGAATAGARAGADGQARAASVVTITEGSLDAFERGLRKEVEAVRAAQQRSRAASTPQARGEAIQATFEHATMPLGAAAAGMSEDEYRQLREAIHGTFRTLDFQGKIDGPMSMDLSRADEATKRRLARDPFDDLPAASAAALRKRMDRLVPLWIEYVRLTAVAG